MIDWAFLVLLTFSAPGDHHTEFKRIQCADMKCVEHFEEDARSSTSLTRFQVFERHSHGIDVTSGKPYFHPIIDWEPI